jgi:hypothetical protein
MGFNREQPSEGVRASLLILKRPGVPIPPNQHFFVRRTPIRLGIKPPRRQGILYFIYPGWVLVILRAAL